MGISFWTLDPKLGQSCQQRSFMALTNEEPDVVRRWEWLGLSASLISELGGREGQLTMLGEKKKKMKPPSWQDHDVGMAIYKIVYTHATGY